MTTYRLSDNGEGTVLTLDVDGVAAAKFYDDAGMKLLEILLCEILQDPNPTIQTQIIEDHTGRIVYSAEQRSAI